MRRELATGQYDAVTVIHNETSCGCMTDIAAVMAVVRQFPEVISVVDTVSSFSALAIKKDELGIDIMITGTQKALALPPGLSLCSVSKRALDRAAARDRARLLPRPARIPGEPREGHDAEHAVASRTSTGSSRSWRTSRPRASSGATPATRASTAPCANGPLPRASNSFPQEGYGSVTLNCFANTLNLDLPALLKVLKAKHGFVIDGGYGKLKGKTFRISNMGDETDETIAVLLRALDSALAETPRLPA